MKNIKLLKLAATLALISTISFASILKADDIILPVITKPAALQEGTQRILTKDQIAELLPWAQNSQVYLKDLLESVELLSSVEKAEKLSDGIKVVVTEVSSKNSELFMRYVLNRALVINETISEEVNQDDVGAADVKLRVLISSIKMALKYYDSDLQTLTKNQNPDFAVFGLEYFNFLNNLNNSIFDASAQYAIQKTSLEWFQWDLYRSLNNQAFAPQIIKINNALKTFPAKNINDAKALSNIRQMKRLVSSMKINDVSLAALKSISNVGNSSCGRIFCVGDSVLYYNNSYVQEATIAHAWDDEVNLTIDSRPLNLVSIKSLALTSGCDANFCVGDKVYNNQNDFHAVIYGLQDDGKYVLYYTGHKDPIAFGWHGRYLSKEE
jgi:hypothetical protein